MIHGTPQIILNALNLNEAGLPLSLMVLLTAVVLPRVPPLRPAWLSMAVRVFAFAILTVLIEHSTESPLVPRFAPYATAQGVLQRAVVAGWWMLAGRVAVGAARLFVVLENRPRETRILSDLLAGAIYVATALAVVTVTFSVALGGLLATSGAIAIVLGVALQSTLSDVFSGISVGLEKPYKVGDFLWVEGGIEGQVVQVNWRSTQIATLDDNIAVVPNNIIAKARLINRSEPTPVRRDSIEVRLDPRAGPADCTAALTAAVRACADVLQDPAPVVACIGLHGDGLTYKVFFSVGTSGDLIAARTELFTQIHRYLRHEGIALAVDGKAKLRPSEAPTLPDLLSRSELFGAMDEALRNALATCFAPIRLGEGDVLLERGVVPAALFVIASGTIGLALPGPDGARLFNRLGPGETLGAAGLVTGLPSTATATALTPLMLHRLLKADLARAVAANPTLGPVLQAMAERVVQAMRPDTMKEQHVAAAAPEMLLRRLRGFLGHLHSGPV